MSNKEDTSPATKADLERLFQQVRAEAKETRHHFDVVAEQLFHDFRGAFGDRTSQNDDKIENHELRLQGVERKLGLVA